MALYSKEPTPTQRASLLALMTATAIATNYLLVGVVNVKFMDLIVFISGLLFGTGFGVTVAALTWLVYGTLNPYGFSFPILSAVIVGESVYGLTGGLFRGKMKTGGSWGPDIRFGVIGFLTTFVYDLFTNVASAIVAGVPIIVGLLSGIPFSAIHELSNAIFFAFGVPPICMAIRRVMNR
jgi:hypothetical protein